MKYIIFFVQKRFYNPPSKRKWSKQNPKYRTKRNLVDKINLHKINIKGEYWKQKHVNKNYVVENDNIDFINQKNSLYFMGYPNISLYNKLGGSLYIEQMDEITLCVIMNKCIKENILDSYIWNKLMYRCNEIMNRINSNILTYIFKFCSQCLYYNHYFLLSIIGNILVNLYSFNVKNCSNILYGMNNNVNYFNEEIYKKIVNHCFLLISNRNDININDILSLISSYKSVQNINNILNNINLQKILNYSYLLFNGISGTINKYDLELCKIDHVISSLLVYCYFDQINLFIQEKNKNVIHKLIHYLNNNLEKLNIKHISVFCFAVTIFHMDKMKINWNYIYNEIKNNCNLLDNNYISMLYYSFKKKEINRECYDVIYNKILDELNNLNVDNMALITFYFLKNKYLKNIKKTNIKDKKIKECISSKIDQIKNNTVRLNNSFNLFNDFLYGKIKNHINDFNMFQSFLILKSLYETKTIENKKIIDIKNVLITHISKNVYNIPFYLLSLYVQIFTENNIQNKDLLIRFRNISLIYLNIYKDLNINNTDYTINQNNSLIEEYYNKFTTYDNNINKSNEIKNIEMNEINIYSDDKHFETEKIQTESNIKSDLNFIYEKKKKESFDLLNKYLIKLKSKKAILKDLNKNFNITEEEVNNVLTFSKNYFFNYYLNEKYISIFFYFSNCFDKTNAILYFNEIKKVIFYKLINNKIIFNPNSILNIFKVLNYLQLFQKENIFFQILLKQLCDQIKNINISNFFQVLFIFYKNNISHYYFLKKARYKLNMNRYELSESTISDMKKMIYELNKQLQ